ncbi:MAG: phosphosulfolactate synthase [Phycisphaerales bacterium]|nr:phosphosulfolactate synthase [Phycisphaerales bacterium]
MIADIFTLNSLPHRSEKPREDGITMVMDKGLNVHEVGNCLAMTHSYIDLLKLGFGTAVVTPLKELEKKIALYHEYNIPVYFGGTLFEAYCIRNQFLDYTALCKRLKISCVEVSDGSMSMSITEKCNFIKQLKNEVAIVISEVGSKDASVDLSVNQWIDMMGQELGAGASWVIAEARESGTVGIYNSAGKAKSDLVTAIVKHIPVNKIIWEAPQKEQQAFFINAFRANANLGNIAISELIALESMRIGLRGDTFHKYIK